MKTRIFTDKEKEFLAHIGSVIRQKRVEKGLKQEYLGQKIGAETATVSRYENGRYNMSILVLKDISDCLDFPMIDYVVDIQPRQYYDEKKMTIDDLNAYLKGERPKTPNYKGLAKKVRKLRTKVSDPFLKRILPYYEGFLNIVANDKIQKRPPRRKAERVNKKRHSAFRKP